MARASKVLTVSKAQNTTPIADAELFAEVCARVATGLTVTEIAEQHGMPSESVIWEWVNRHPDRAELLRKARAAGTHKLVDEVIKIADKARNTHQDIRKAQLRIDTRLKVAALLNKADYGKSVDEDHEPIQVVIKRFDSPVTDVEARVVEDARGSSV